MVVTRVERVPDGRVSATTQQSSRKPLMSHAGWWATFPSKVGDDDQLRPSALRYNEAEISTQLWALATVSAPARVRMRPLR